MASGGGHLQRPAGPWLSDDIGQVRGIVQLGLGLHARRRQLAAAMEPGGHFQQGSCMASISTPGQPGLQAVFTGNNEPPFAFIGLKGSGQNAPYRQQFTAEGKLAHELVAFQRAVRHLTRGRQDAQRDRQIEAAAHLGQLGRRQGDGHAGNRELKAAVL
jgi:hypothetical protein